MPNIFSSWSVTSIKRMPRIGKKIVKPRYRDMHMGGTAPKKGKPPRGFVKSYEGHVKRAYFYRRVR